MPNPIPAGLLQPLGTGAGWHEVVGGAQPAAAADFTLAMDGRFTTRVLAVTVRLVADANVANRSVRVQYEDAAGNVLAFTGSAQVQTAGQTVDYSFLANVSAGIAVSALQAIGPLPPIFLRPTDLLRIDVANVQAGDQLSRVFLTLERFFTDGPL